MTVIKTAKGRQIDMSEIARNNEKVRAVGNVPMNARGDKLDKHGNIIKTHEEVERAQVEELKKEESSTEKSSKKRTRKKTSESETSIVRQEEKTRNDGTTYKEVEYNDGSIAIIESKE